jgi:hypothetical protein
MASMGLISRGAGIVLDALPRWAKFILAVIFIPLVILGSVQLIARDGLFTFLMKLIFTPDL